MIDRYTDMQIGQIAMSRSAPKWAEEEVGRRWRKMVGKKREAIRTQKIKEDAMHRTKNEIADYLGRKRYAFFADLHSNVYGNKVLIKSALTSLIDIGDIECQKCPQSNKTGYSLQGQLPSIEAKSADERGSPIPPLIIKCLTDARCAMRRDAVAEKIGHRSKTVGDWLRKMALDGKINVRKINNKGHVEYWVDQ